MAEAKGHGADPRHRGPGRRLRARGRHPQRCRRERREGEIVTVVGPNGAGKSTLIKSIFGLLPPRGEGLLRGEDLAGLAPHSITRRGMSYVPQLDNVFQSLTVEENLEMGALEASGAE